jgi:hypothetical protein
MPSGRQLGTRRGRHAIKHPPGWLTTICTWDQRRTPSSEMVRSRSLSFWGDRQFESVSLQRGVSCELDFLDQARRLYTLEPRLLLLPRRLRIGGFGTCEIRASRLGVAVASCRAPLAGLMVRLRFPPAASRANCDRVPAADRAAERCRCRPRPGRALD